MLDFGEEEEAAAAAAPPLSPMPAAEEAGELQSSAAPDVAVAIADLTDEVVDAAVAAVATPRPVASAGVLLKDGPWSVVDWKMGHF